MQLIALKDGPGKKLLIDVDNYPGVRCLGDLDPNSGSVTELYKNNVDMKLVNQFWQNVILDSNRKLRQKRLCKAILANASTSALLEKSMSQLSQDEINSFSK